MLLFFAQEKKEELKSVQQQYEARISQLNIDHQSAINELEFRLEHQESQHQNELSDLEARLRDEMQQMAARNQDKVSKYSKVVRGLDLFLACLRM